MAEFIPFEAGNVIGVRIGGKLSEAELENILAVVEDRMEDHAKLRLYVEIPSFDGIAPKALFKDLKFGLKHWDRFEKEAIVTGTDWIRTVGPAVGKLFPDLEVRAFKLTQKAAAEQWIVQ